MPHLLRSIAGLLRVMANMTYTAGVIWAAWIIGEQCYGWLKLSEWKEKPFLYYCGEMFYADWLFFPGDWLGVHRALNSLNAGIGILMCSVLIAVVICLFAFSLENKAIQVEFPGKKTQ